MRSGRRSLEDRLQDAVERSEKAKAEATKKEEKMKELKKQVLAERKEIMLDKIEKSFPEKDIALMSRNDFEKFMLGMQISYSDPGAETVGTENVQAKPAAAEQSRPSELQRRQNPEIHQSVQKPVAPKPQTQPAVTHTQNTPEGRRQSLLNGSSVMSNLGRHSEESDEQARRREMEELARQRSSQQ